LPAIQARAARPRESPHAEPSPVPLPITHHLVGVNTNWMRTGVGGGSKSGCKRALTCNLGTVQAIQNQVPPVEIVGLFFF